MSIKELQTKIKRSYINTPFEVFIIIIIILTGFSSFGLGKLSSFQDEKQEIKILYDENMSFQPSFELKGAVVASKKGTKYHYPWCPGAISIKQENKVWFGSEKEARNAGYLPASNCKGLK